MFSARQLILPVSLLIVGVAIGCTTSEPYSAPVPGTGGAMVMGTGGMMGTGGAMGSGGTMGSGGAMGTGGMVMGTGGAPVVDGGADMGGADTGPALTFAANIQPVLMRVCGGCHGAAGGLNVSTLAGVTGPINAMHTACAKTDAMKRRIVPGNPDMSYLYAKITTPMGMSVGANCGTAMPVTGMLTAQEKTMIGNWITQGAK